MAAAQYAVIFREGRDDLAHGLVRGISVIFLGDVQVLAAN